MFTINDYLLMQAMSNQNAQGAAPAPAPMPAAPAAPLPAHTSPHPYYESLSPIRKGVLEAYDASQRKPSMMYQLGNVIGDFGKAMLRGNAHPVAQAFGHMYPTSEEERHQEEKHIMEQLNFLNQAEQINSMNQYHQATLAEQRLNRERMAEEHRLNREEQMRHHQAEEALRGEHYKVQDSKIKSEVQTEAENEQARQLFGRDDVYSLKGASPAERRERMSEMVERAEKPTKAAPTLEVIGQMVDIVKAFPDLSSSLTKALNPSKENKSFLSDLWRGVPSLTQEGRRKRKAIEMMEKLGADLVVKHAEDGGARNRFIQQIASVASPNGDLLPESVYAMYKKALKEYEEDVADSQFVRQAMPKGIYAPKRLPEINIRQAPNIVKQQERDELLAERAGLLAQKARDEAQRTQ